LAVSGRAAGAVPLFPALRGLGRPGPPPGSRYPQTRGAVKTLDLDGMVRPRRPLAFTVPGRTGCALRNWLKIETVPGRVV
ncbi:MAG: hypothetical protein ACE5ID_02325, partial [Acidobacteriota bacterium]